MPISTTKKTIEIELKREAGVTTFHFKVDPAITALYAAQSQEIKESKAWPGLKFHYLPSVIESDGYKKLLRNYNLFDNYGSSLVNTDGGRQLLNIAWIRTVNSEGTIVIGDGITIAEMSIMIKNVTQFIKEYFEEYFRSCSIKGKVEVEI